VFLERWALDHEIELKVFNPSNSARHRIKEAQSVMDFEISTIYDVSSLLPYAEEHGAHTTSETSSQLVKRAWFCLLHSTTRSVRSVRSNRCEFRQTRDLAITAQRPAYLRSSPRVLLALRPWRRASVRLNKASAIYGRKRMAISDPYHTDKEA
jgi:hypothetical protein